MRTPLELFLTGLCILIPIGILVVSAILGTRSRLRYADRLQKALAQGAFDDMNTPENKIRFRRLAIFALIGLLGMLVSFTILIILLILKLTDFYGITFAVVLVFGIIGASAGFLTEREIKRRL